MSSVTDIQVVKESDGTIFRTSDIKMTAALVTAGISIVDTGNRVNARNGRKEIVFGFQHSPQQRAAGLAFLSGELRVDARSLLDNRDSLISYVSNGAKELLENLNTGG